MNPLLLPVELPLRVAARIADDTRAMARRFDSRLEAIQQQIGTAVEMFGDLRKLATDGVAMIGMLDQQMRSVATSMRAVHETLVSIDEQTQRLNAGLPAVQRGFQLLEPLEGTVERVGRVVDRLPRWISGEPKHPQAQSAAPPPPSTVRYPPAAAPPEITADGAGATSAPAVPPRPAARPRRSSGQA